MSKLSMIWIGYDPRETDAFLVTRESARRRLTQPIPIRSLWLPALRSAGLYKRPTRRLSNNQLWDDISNAPMSTEFAISRFLVPHLTQMHMGLKQPAGWSIFMDGDMLVRTSLCRLGELAQSEYAVMVVKHNHFPRGMVKMDAQIQTAYPRKNWSSMILFNCEHPSNKKLTLEMVNTLPGRDLHRFCWLEDSEIGELDLSWNWLVGNSPACESPGIVHFTDGVPSMSGYDKVEYSKEWRDELGRAVGGRLGI